MGLAVALSTVGALCGGHPALAQEKVLKVAMHADVRTIDDLGLPTLADAPDVTVELIASQSDPGGVSELAVPPVAPAIANALQAATGVRFRTLPLLSDVE